MKATKIIEETMEERALRQDRERRSDGLLQEIERIQLRGARFNDAKQMLGWFFAMYGRMESAPAIDPAREVVQGIQVDRDERIHVIAYVKKALKDVAKKQGNDRGVHLLWLHFRAPAPTGRRRTEADGRKVDVYGGAGIAIRELHEHDGHPASRNETIREFWRAFRLFEDIALEKGWVKYRLERRGEGTPEVRTFHRKRGE